MHSLVNNVIASAKADTMKMARDKGCACPVCGQFVKVYRRTINKTAARLLLKAYTMFIDYHSFHITDLIEGGGGDFAKLRYWSLIEAIENDNPKKKSSGKWIITELGTEFLNGQIRMPKYALIYDGKFLDFDGPESVTFKECLGEDFNYQELMNA